MARGAHSNQAYIAIWPGNYEAEGIIIRQITADIQKREVDILPILELFIRIMGGRGYCMLQSRHFAGELAAVQLGLLS